MTTLWLCTLFSKLLTVKATPHELHMGGISEQCVSRREMYFVTASITMKDLMKTNVNDSYQDFDIVSFMF
jgi:hypothetical protein